MRHFTGKFQRKGYFAILTNKTTRHTYIYMFTGQGSHRNANQIMHRNYGHKNMCMHYALFWYGVNIDNTTVHIRAV